jgi:hypothetical protein
VVGDGRNRARSERRRVNQRVGIGRDGDMLPLRDSAWSLPAIYGGSKIQSPASQLRRACQHYNLVNCRPHSLALRQNGNIWAHHPHSRRSDSLVFRRFGGWTSVFTSLKRGQLLIGQQAPSSNRPLHPDSTGTTFSVNKGLQLLFQLGHALAAAMGIHG